VILERRRLTPTHELDQALGIAPLGITTVVVYDRQRAERVARAGPES
jgi:hypothetical protein